MPKIVKEELLSAITLESAYATTQAATSRKVVDTSDKEKLNLFVSYTTGAGETTNSCEVIVEGYVGTLQGSVSHPYSSTVDTEIKADSGRWVQLGAYAIATGTATYTPTVFQVAGAAAATTYTGHFIVDIEFSKIRVAAKETGVATNKGTATVIAVVR